MLEHQWEAFKVFTTTQQYNHLINCIVLYSGSLESKSATELGAVAISKAVTKIDLPQSAVQEVAMGCVLQGGLGQAPARQAALFAGLNPATPCTTINKVCASGMKAIMLSATNLALGLQVDTQ